MSQSESKDGGGAQGNVVAFRSADEGVGKKGADPAIVYFPDGLKRHYMDLLLRYKQEQSELRGKPVGWQTIRDEVMAREDALVAARMRRQKLEVEVDRPRSDLVTLEDFKGWYHRSKSHLPSDVKFQYIDRFLRGLRAEGALDSVESAWVRARRAYLMEALGAFYKPDIAYCDIDYQGGGDTKYAEKAARSIDRKIFVADFLPEADTAFPGEGRYLFIVFCGEVENSICPANILACFVPRAVNIAPSVEGGLKSVALSWLKELDLLACRYIYQYAGFIVAEKYGSVSPLDTLALAANFVLCNPSGASQLASGLQLRLPRQYNPRVHVFETPAGKAEADRAEVKTAISWPLNKDEFFRALGLELITQPATSMLDAVSHESLAGFVEVSDGWAGFEALCDLRERVSVGYRPC